MISYFIKKFNFYKNFFYNILFFTKNYKEINLFLIMFSNLNTENINCKIDYLSIKDNGLTVKKLII